MGHAGKVQGEIRIIDVHARFMNYFVTAIDTDSGKTLVSAIICEALGADYWKPVQAGLPRDTEVVETLVSNSQTKFHAEKFLLTTPASPHAAAMIDGVTIALEDFNAPVANDLVVEGAGGCLVPLNEKDFVIDLVIHLNCKIIVVADLYLGSINHTLMTMECLAHRNLPVSGIIFNGESNAESERIILHHTQVPCLLRVELERSVDKSVVQKYAILFRKNLHGSLKS